jgi:type IV fimbrial biogenesis protein FimT
MKQRGFSIIEIAVTLVVLGILMTSAMPNISSWLRNTKLRNQAETTLGGLQQARNEAVRRNRPISFWLVSLETASQMDDHCTVSATGTSWVVSGASPDGKCSTPPSASTAPQIVSTRVGADGSNGVSVSGLKSDGSTAASSVTFDGFGRATGDLRRINISFASTATDDRPLRIEISPSGLTRMCDTLVTTSGDPRKCSASNFQ